MLILKSRANYKENLICEHKDTQNTGYGKTCVKCGLIIEDNICFNSEYDYSTRIYENQESTIELSQKWKTGYNINNSIMRVKKYFKFDRTVRNYRDVLVMCDISVLLGQLEIPKELDKEIFDFYSTLRLKEKEKKRTKTVKIEPCIMVIARQKGFLIDYSSFVGISDITSRKFKETLKIINQYYPTNYNRNELVQKYVLNFISCLNLPFFFYNDSMFIFKKYGRFYSVRAKSIAYFCVVVAFFSHKISTQFNYTLSKMSNLIEHVIYVPTTAFEIFFRENKLGKFNRNKVHVLYKDRVKIFGENYSV